MVLSFEKKVARNGFLGLSKMLLSYRIVTIATHTASAESNGGVQFYKSYTLPYPWWSVFLVQK